MAEVKWIKLSTDMFNNAKIKYLRTLPEGNNIILIWVMLLAKAGKCNSNGFIFLTENIPYTKEMLASEFGFELNTITLALGALEKLNMIETKEETLLITGWEEHQNIDGLDKIRKQNRKRQAKFRSKQKASLGKIEDNNVSSNVTDNGEVTQSNAIDKEKEIDKDIDKEIITTTSSDSDFNIFKYAEMRNFIFSAIQLQQIQDDINTYSLEEVKKALDIADDNGKHSYSYVRGILQKRRSGDEQKKQSDSKLEEMKRKAANGEDPF